MGRPLNAVKREAFIKVTEYPKANNEEQTTIYDLIDKMGELLHSTGLEPYGFMYMKTNLPKHFGDGIIIAEMHGYKNIVALKGTASSVLKDLYQRPKLPDAETEKMRAIETAASLIKDDIKTVVQDKDIYPTSLSMSTIEAHCSIYPRVIAFASENSVCGY